MTMKKSEFKDCDIYAARIAAQNAAHPDAADVGDVVTIDTHQRGAGAHRHDNDVVQAAVKACP